MPRPIKFAIGACFLLFLQQAVSKTYDECELALELREQGFSQDQLDKWICIIKAESSMSTDAVGGPDSDGSYDFGLFQINSRYWCSDAKTPGNGCNVSCSDLLSDDITEAAACAKKVYEESGYSAWVGWNQTCRDLPIPTLNC